MAVEVGVDVTVGLIVKVAVGVGVEVTVGLKVEVPIEVGVDVTVGLIVKVAVGVGVATGELIWGIGVGESGTAAPKGSAGLALGSFWQAAVPIKRIKPKPPIFWLGLMSESIALPCHRSSF